MVPPESQEKFQKRKNPRLSGYDYSTPNYYFITICTHEKQCIFGKPSKLNKLGKIAEKGLNRIADHFPGVFVDKYVVMPNHVHAIIVLEDSSVTLPVVIGQYKAFVTKSIHAFLPDQVVWQTSFHDHIIRNQHSYEKIWSYIETNPNQWNEDCFHIE